jgi:hypothetical protein
MIYSYSRRAITFVSDRLPALAGIASRLETPLTGAYLYGLWENDLHRGILFTEGTQYSHLNYSPDQTPTWRDVPSWSWAALSNSFGWNDLWKPGTVEACQVQVVKPRTLRLSGMLISLCSRELHDLRIFRAAGSVKVQDGIQGNSTAYVYADQWFLRKFKDDWAVADNPDAQHGPDITSFDAFRAAAVAMPILFREVYTKDTIIRRRSAVCLLLYVQPGLDKGSYRRVGIAEIQFLVPDEDINTLKAALRTYQEPLQNPWYHESNGEGEYTISVV